MSDKRNQVKTNRMLIAGISLGVIYWIIDTFLYIISSYEPTLIRGLFGPGLERASTRIIVLCLFIIFGSHVQYTFEQKKRAESEFEKLKKMNKELQRKIAEYKKK